MSKIRKLWNFIQERLSFYWKHAKGDVIRYAAIALAFLTVGGFFLFSMITKEKGAVQEDIPTAFSESSGEEDEEKEEQAAPSMIYIDIAGAVQLPGVVTLSEGSRVFEAIEKAGGLLPDADVSEINQAEILLDGDFIRIPRKSDNETADKTFHTSKNEAVKSSGRVNLNRAAVSELTALSGIGPATAERILEYRQEHGRFRSVDDLKNVKGIGEKKLEKIRDRVTI